MKSRAVAGNSEAATKFLHELQQADWRRYGQSGRSRGMTFARCVPDWSGNRAQ